MVNLSCWQYFKHKEFFLRGSVKDISKIIYEPSPNSLSFQDEMVLDTSINNQLTIVNNLSTV